MRIDLEHFKRRAGYTRIDRAVRLDLREVAHTAQQPVGDPRGSARTTRDLNCAFGRHGHLQQPGAARHDAGELFGRVEIKPGGNAEALAQGVRQHARARGRPDQRERLEIELDASCSRALADHDVDLKVFERRVEDFLNDRRKAVDFVDEKNIVALKAGQ